MHGPGQIGSIINVQRIDPHKNNTFLDKILSGIPGQEGVALEIPIRAPVNIPT